MTMTREEWREFKRHGAETDRMLLDRIEYHRKKLIEEGSDPYPSEEWIAFHRRHIEKTLADLGD